MFCSCSCSLGWTQEPCEQGRPLGRAHLHAASLRHPCTQVSPWVSRNRVSQSDFHGLSALTCSHVPGLVNGGDYGICHPRRNYKRETMLWILVGMFHSGQGDHDARSPEGRCLVNRWQEIWAGPSKMGRPFLTGFRCVFLGPSFSSKLCYLKCLSHLQTLSPAQVYEEFSRICT